MSVAETDIALQAISWDDCNRVLPSPRPPSPYKSWDSRVAAATKSARKQIWISGNNSQENIDKVCLAALRQVDPLGGQNDALGLMPWYWPMVRELAKDLTITQLPALEGVSCIMSEIEAWWPDHWARQDKADIERALAYTSASIEFEFSECENQADVCLARLLWLEKLRSQFSGRPVTLEELSDLRHRRRVCEIGEKYSAGLSDVAALEFFTLLDEFAKKELDVPVNSDSVQEVMFSRGLQTVGLSQEERCRVAAALLQTAADVNSERCLQANSAIHPIHGYALIFGDAEKAMHKTLVGAAPGRWRLQIEGEQYILTCDLWPRPVVMSHHEFGRARGSANAILRDVGVSVDSPPGHWKKIWETCGLRSQLLLAAQRVDPQIRLEEVLRWINQIASEAPVAHRPPTDGSPARLADGATVADVRWLIERALADGVIMPHERAAMEREIRRRAAETNRRDAGKRQRKLLVLNAGSVASGNSLINTPFSGVPKNIDQG